MQHKIYMDVLSTVLTVDRLADIVRAAQVEDKGILPLVDLATQLADELSTETNETLPVDVHRWVYLELDKD